MGVQLILLLAITACSASSFKAKIDLQDISGKDSSIEHPIFEGGARDFSLAPDSANDIAIGDAKGISPDASASCTALSCMAGNTVLGYASSGSSFNALIFSQGQVAAAWEFYYGSGEGETRFAIQDASGKIVLKSVTVDKSDFPSAPALVSLGNQYGIVHVRNKSNQELQYLVVDAKGAVLKKEILAQGIGQYVAEPTMALGALGDIAVGYMKVDSPEKSQVLLGLIDKDGAFTKAFSPLVTNGNESRYLKVISTKSGYVAVWTESRASSLWAVVATWLDSSLNRTGTTKDVTLFEDAQKIYQRPAIASVGDDVLVCAEEKLPDQDASIICRTVKASGVLGKPTATSITGLSLRRPQVVAGNQRFAVLWTAVTLGMEEVYGRLFSTSGTPVGDAKKLSEPGVRSWSPSVVYTGETFSVVWFRYIPITVYLASFRLTCTP